MTIRFFLRSSLPLAAATVLALALGAPPAAGEDAAPAPSAPQEAPAGARFEPGAPPFAEVLAKAKAEGKLVFLDFFTEW
jgi:hypothetical protein